MTPIGPLVLWQMKKDPSGYVTYHSKEALNFQITTTVLAVVSMVLTLVLIGIPLLIALETEPASVVPLSPAASVAAS